MISKNIIKSHRNKSQPLKTSQWQAEKMQYLDKQIMIPTANKIIPLLLILVFPNLSFSQTIINKLDRDKRTKENKEMICEMESLFQKIASEYQLDFNKSDTLFIIHGQDITSGSGYGYVWNMNLKVQYINRPNWQHSKIKNTVLTVNIKNDSTTWYEFDGLIPLIENWDTTGINQYVDKHDQVLGSIYTWSIIRLIKQNKNYHLDQIKIREFGMLRKQSQPLTRTIKCICLSRFL
jgi:hypothetical protein